MRRLVLAIVIIGTAAGVPAAARQEKVVFVDHAKVKEGGSLVTAPNLLISMSRREGVGQSELHDTETDTFYVLSGTATFVVGGEMVESKQTGPGQYRGSGLKGGKAHQLSAGDVVVVPAGVPHWFKDVPGPFDYYIVKVLKP